MEHGYQLEFLRVVDFSPDSSFIIIVGSDTDGILYLGFSGGAKQNKWESVGAPKLLGTLIQKLRSIRETSQICRTFSEGYLLAISLVVTNPSKNLLSLEDLLPNFDFYHFTAVFIKIRKYMYLIIIYEASQLSTCRNIVRTIISYAYVNREYIKIYFLPPMKVLNLIACVLKKSFCRELKYLAIKYSKQKLIEFVNVIHTIISRRYQQDSQQIASTSKYLTANSKHQLVRYTERSLKTSMEYHTNKQIESNNKNFNPNPVDSNNPPKNKLIKIDEKKNVVYSQKQNIQTQNKRSEIHSEIKNFLVVVVDPIFTKKKIITHPIILKKLFKENS